MEQNYSEGLLKQMGCHPSIYISNKFAGDADAAGPNTTVGELLLHCLLCSHLEITGSGIKEKYKEDSL